MLLQPDLLNRVTYSKYLLRRSKERHTIGNELASAEAVLAAHDATEMLMRVITDYYGIKSGEFMEFWQSVLDKTGKTVPYKGQMDRFNQLRVGWKHRGILPNPGVVSSLLPVVENLCSEISLEFLGANFDEISLADLIRNSEVRDKLKEAEQAKARNDLETALTSLGLAFDRLIADAQRGQEKSLLSYEWSAPRVSDARIQELVNSLKLDTLAKGLDYVIDAVNMLLLGVDPLKYQKFSQVTPLRQHASTGNPLVIWQRDSKNVKDDEYEESYQFVLDSALKLSV